MIVVLDSNVIISALLSPKGAPAEIIGRWEAGELGVVTSPHLIAELKRALEYGRVKKYLKRPRKMATALVNQFEAVATVLAPAPSLDVIKEDAADNRVLECALAGNASYIVTGDSHLLNLKTYQGIVILNPGGYMALVRLGKQG
jgi:putative PIN family toxin of toxin-antitoxin system